MFHLQPIHSPTGQIIQGWNHAWHVHLDTSRRVNYVPSGLPPPFEAYGQQAHFVLDACTEVHPKLSCRDYTVKEAAKAGVRLSTVFLNYNTVFGVLRNKRDALNTKKRKAAIVEEESESSSEEEELEKEEEESSSEEEESVISADSSEEESLEEEEEEEEEEDTKKK
jgi:hypothetical protein